MIVKLDEELRVIWNGDWLQVRYKGATCYIQDELYRLIDLGDLYTEEEDDQIVAGKYKTGGSCSYLSPTDGVMVISKDMKKEWCISSINDLGFCV